MLIIIMIQYQTLEVAIRLKPKIKGVLNGISCCYELRYKMQVRKIDWKTTPSD